ncbi:MAG: methyl-accepting chemotaxis protein [Nitrospirae bacterium]|nr:methyl-accepting chemotaxis protein [Nitrospirota bacterium]
MKINLPVTGVNRPVGARTIVSTTDLKGSITHANSDFIDISGFTLDELIGKNHNLVRHPEMPPEAFADLWNTLKAGHPWMGIVKNRTKNGDHYWVDAFVTAIYEGNEPAGYQSVRVDPKPEYVKRAETLYQCIRDGKAPRLRRFDLSIPARAALGTGLLVSGVTAFLTYFGGASLMAGALILPPALILSYAAGRIAVRSLTRAAEEAKKIVHNPLAQMVYTGTSCEAGALLLAVRMLEAKLRTVIGRIGESSTNLASSSEQTAAASLQTSEGVSRQKTAIDQVATAINEMSATVQEVSRNIDQAARSAGTAKEEVEVGREEVMRTIEATRALAEEVTRASEVIQRLEADSGSIGIVVDVIQGIAEQTNLLALNAAIEAARAGNQGRGFAVVADEVRSLAEQTQKSTREILQIVEKLQGVAHEAVQVMAQGRSRAEAGVRQAARAGQSLETIDKSVAVISDMSAQIASAAEEQSAVAEDVNRNISDISRVAEQTSVGAQQTAAASKHLSELAGNLQGMVRQFGL